MGAVGGSSFQAISILNGSQRIRIERCHCINWTQYGIVVGDAGTNSGCNDIRILHNIVDASAAVLANGSIGIECFPKSSSLSYSVTPGLIIEGNSVLGSAGNIYAGIKVSWNRGVRITGNYINGISSTNPEGAIDVNGCPGAVIAFNVIDTSAIGIDIGGLADVIQTAESEIVCSGNIITNFTNFGIQLNPGLVGLAITGNHLTLGSGGGTHGIYAPAWTTTLASTQDASGFIQVNIGTLQNYVDGSWVLIAGTSHANGYWQISNVVNGVSTTTFILVGSTWSSTDSAGTVTAVFQDLVITGNRLNGTDIYINGPAPGASVTGNKLTGGGMLVTDNNVAVDGNSVNMIGIGGSVSCIAVNGNNSSITGNTCIGSNAYGIDITGNDDSVTGNTCQTCGQGAILVTGNDSTITGNTASASPGGVSAVGNSHVVTGNKVLTATTGISTNGTDNQVHGNSIRLSTEFGILCAGNYASIQDNKILDCNTSGASTVSGIFLSSCSDAQIIGNHIENRTSLVGLLYYGVTYGSNSGLVMRDNRIIAMQTAEVFATGSSGTQPRSQDVYTDTTAQSAGSDTTEDTLKTTGSTFNAGCLGLQGGFRVHVTGTCSGSGGSKTIKVYLSTTAVPVGGLTVASGTNNWTIECEFWNDGTESSQTIS